MHTTLSQQKFLESEKAADVKKELIEMESNPLFNTSVSHNVGIDAADSFWEKHLKYLSLRPKLDPDHYVSNLKLMTRLKQRS